ncbi:hypothetical protein [Nocardioides marmorisolisilvae]|uniref:Uncharacterized protein n=1 Tax=Nocardioides marmorisolisilvae TaxID=1542737 RepID=A0A3N0DVV6_9ACTN|nr:hypothetical protein [Nocardioides marmorisolisilvae]RNL79626.1 hypothetical protein EFL95_11700 [Nocardioides marmorisolisilvae]
MSVTTGVPELAEEAVDALPRRRPAVLRSLLPVVAAVAAFVPVVLFTGERGTGSDAIRMAVYLAPWALALPWLKRLDLRPVPWFFLCAALGFVMAPVLAYKVVHRALSLPFRDWEVGFWHGHLARSVPGMRALVLLPAGSVPEPVVPRWVRRADGVQRGAWIFFLVAFPVGVAFGQSWPAFLGSALVVGLFVLMVSHVVVAVLLSDWFRKRTVRTA